MRTLTIFQVFINTLAKSKNSLMNGIYLTAKLHFHTPSHRTIHTSNQTKIPIDFPQSTSGTRKIGGKATQTRWH